MASVMPLRRGNGLVPNREDQFIDDDSKPAYPEREDQALEVEAGPLREVEKSGGIPVSGTNNGSVRPSSKVQRLTTSISRRLSALRKEV